MGLPRSAPPCAQAPGCRCRRLAAFTAVAIGVMLTLVPWGVLTDRIGERPGHDRGPRRHGGSRSPARTRPGFVMVLAGLLAAGMLGASSTGASGRAVMGWFARSERGLALGIRQMALPLGGAAPAVAFRTSSAPAACAARSSHWPGLCLTAAMAAGCAHARRPLPDRPPRPASRRLRRCVARV